MADYECCANCGKETDVPVDYIGVGGLRYPQTVFCSVKCELEWLVRTDDCKNCGKTSIGKDYFCSEECSEKWLEDIDKMLDF